MSGSPKLCRRRFFSQCWYWVAVALSAGVLAPLQRVDAATLQQLLGGGSMTVLNSRLSDWQLVSLDATSGANIDLSSINVNALVADPLNPGVQFAATEQLSVAGVNALDIILKYRVQAINGGNSYTGHTLSLTGISFTTNGGIGYLADEVRSNLGASLGSAVVIDDKESNESTFVATANFAAQASALVTTNVFLTGINAADSINLTSFTQRFAQTGAPMLAGDYNLNGRVDAADYVLWRNSNGPPEGFAVWRENFGQVLSGAGAAVGSGDAVTAVPEPTVIVLGGLGVLLIGCAPPRNRRRR